MGGKMPRTRSATRFSPPGAICGFRASAATDRSTTHSSTDLPIAALANQLEARLPGGRRPQTTISAIFRAISAAERTKSTWPVFWASSGISDHSAVSGVCTIVVPPTRLMSPNAAAPSPSRPDTMTAISFPSQFFASERRKIVITSGHPLVFETGFRRNSPSRRCNSRFAGMIYTWSG